MKISVITRHAITNYGSLLQAYATQTVIEKLGHDCEIINYIRDDESFQKHEMTILKKKAGWYNNPVKRFAYLAIRQPSSILAGRRFEKRQKKFLKLSQLYTDAKQLVKQPPIADAYLTGSDQVWGPMENGEYDSSYCLSFVPNHAKKIAYAASFGHTNMSEDLQTYFQKWLSEYQHIAVREDSAVEILESLNISAAQVLDPTLLLTAQEWSQFVKRKKKGRYVLVYQLHNDKKLGEYAKKVAEKKGLPLIRISVSMHQILRPGRFIWSPSIEEFLSYIKYADCMITDSFHGTAFAINFNTPFIEVLPNNSTGTRNLSILKLLNLSDRILQDVKNLELAEKVINYDQVNQIMEEQRIQSIDVLKKMIDE